MGSASSSARFEKLGHRLMCTCGCNQVLLECNHVGCPSSDGMRRELSAGMAQNSSDDGVFAIFVEKYGPVVLAAPTMNGFDRAAWITPYATLALGLGLVMIVVRKWKHVPVKTEVNKLDDPEEEERRKRIR